MQQEDSIIVVIFLSILIFLNLSICSTKIENVQLHRYRKRNSVASSTLRNKDIPDPLINAMDSFQSPLVNKHMCFYSNSACERGTEIAMFDYAHFVEIMFGMKSYIIFPRHLENANKWTDVSIYAFLK